MDSVNERLRVLIITNAWPRFLNDINGIHVVNQVTRLREQGVDVKVFVFRGRKKLSEYLRAILQLRNEQLDNYDLIHAHHGQSGVVALAQSKLPTVVTFHGSDLQGIRTRSGRITILGYILKFASYRVALKASAVIIVSEHLKQYLPKCNYHIIPAGIDCEVFKPMPQNIARQLLGWNQDEKVVLFVGDPKRTEKRYWLAEKTINALKERMPVALMLAHNISPSTMPIYMNGSDVLLVTSLTEGSPNAVKEAIACNLPIVSVDVGDIKQRIKFIDGCVTCNNDHPETIIEAVESVLRTGQRINGRASISELDEHILSQKVIEVYRSVLVNAKR